MRELPPDDLQHFIETNHYSNYAILSGHVVVPTADVLVWAKWFEEHTKERIVKQETIEGLYISTVFLGMNHGFGGKRSLWFETMIFEAEALELDQDMWRCATWAEAEAQHAEAVAKVRAATGNT